MAIVALLFLLPERMKILTEILPFDEKRKRKEALIIKPCKRDISELWPPALPEFNHST